MVHATLTNAVGRYGLRTSWLCRISEHASRVVSDSLTYSDAGRNFNKIKRTSGGHTRTFRSNEEINFD